MYQKRYVRMGQIIFINSYFSCNLDFLFQRYQMFNVNKNQAKNSFKNSLYNINSIDNIIVVDDYTVYVFEINIVCDIVCAYIRDSKL